MDKLNEGVGALKMGGTGTPLRTMSKGTIFAKNTDFLQKSWYQQNKNVLATERYIFETTYACVLTYQILSFWDNSNKF